ncbi:MAG TPA: hypothetical protein VH143_30510 [Kofleriaceae bacterium]|jgi:hypothetical protein|nr:hypothetical protein [Kofleriaceae bacterium]
MTTTKSIVLVLVAGLLGAGFIRTADADDSAGASFADSSSSQTAAPEIVIPATGDAPVEATPVGGDMYVPVTGGAPIVGIAT